MRLLEILTLLFLIFSIQTKKQNKQSTISKNTKMQAQQTLKDKNFVPKSFRVKKHSFKWSLFKNDKQFLGYFRQVPDQQNSRIELVAVDDEVMGAMEYDLTFIPFLSNQFTVMEQNGEFLAKIVDDSGLIFGGKKYSIYDENQNLQATMKCNYETIENQEGESLANMKIQDPFLGNRKWQFSLLKNSSSKINRIVYAFLPIAREFDKGFFGSFFTEL